HTWLSRRNGTMRYHFHPRPDAAAASAQANRDKVQRRRANIVGRQRIGAVTVIHLREIVHVPSQRARVPKSFKPPKGFRLPKLPAMTYRLDTWVDPLTYLTIRSEYTAHGRSAVTNEEWLERTAANVAKTIVRIPRGFTRERPRNGSTMVL